MHKNLISCKGCLTGKNNVYYTMEKNTVTLDLKYYHELKDFKKEIEEGKICISSTIYDNAFSSTHKTYMSKDDYHKEIVTTVNEFRDKTIEQEEKNLKLRIENDELKDEIRILTGQLKEKKKLNRMQRIFNW